ncbi:hypothetical protein [Cohnella silvisoli]|uniref:Uncharacterized protein n=1 Tax=Cohnella silvisoli TaxID=2873699 RepID=A0ABV1L1Z8_9BACL|nr:hypothetical protein [Cohnella silvisoli]MCD9025092.1 hypothetical protein [Cohnella silvisoli]
MSDTLDFTGFPKEGLQFLKDLADNNNRIRQASAGSFGMAIVKKRTAPPSTRGQDRLDDRNVPILRSFKLTETL